MRIAIAAIASLAASGCIATRYSPPLDRELSEAGSRFLESRSVVVQPDDAPGNDVDGSIARTVENPLGTVTVLRNQSTVWPGRGFQCFEPYLYVLTLGIIPADCTNDYVFEATLEDRESRRSLRREYTVTAVQGWVSGLLPFLPGWELGSEPPPSTRAFNTCVNQLASSGVVAPRDAFLADSSCHAGSVDATTERPMAICLAHPDFEPSSIDHYDPGKAQDWEKDFYEGAKLLHRTGSQPMDVLLEERESAPPERVRCVDAILNTWPG